MTVTVEDVALWAKIDPPISPSPEHDLFQQVIDAIVEHLAGRYKIATTEFGDPTPEFFDARTNLAIKMQAARVWGRRSNPYGVAEFADIAALRITELDADVKQLLTRRLAVG